MYQLRNIKHLRIIWAGIHKYWWYPLHINSNINSIWNPRAQRSWGTSLHALKRYSFHNNSHIDSTWKPRASLGTLHTSILDTSRGEFSFSIRSHVRGGGVVYFFGKKSNIILVHRKYNINTRKAINELFAIASAFLLINLL